MTIEQNGPPPDQMEIKTEPKVTQLFKEKTLGDLGFALSVDQMRWARWMRDYEKNIPKIDTMIKKFGVKFIEEKLSSGENLEKSKKRLENFNENVIEGAFAGLIGKTAGPLGGYYGGYDKEGKLNIEAVDIESWAKMGAKKLTVSLEEQADLLRGFFVSELALDIIDKTAFMGAGAFETLKLIARVEGRKPQDVAISYSDLFKQLREEFEDKKVFDQAVSKVNLLWDEKQGEYIKM